MPVDSSLVGRTFAPTPPYDVTSERVAEFAAATQTSYTDGDPAPVTFPIVVAFAAMQQLMSDPAVGIELSHVIHGEQRFEYTRPVLVGDILTARLSVERLRQVAGVDIISTSSAISDSEDALVCTARASLVHRSG
ncbi:MAG: MaoC family dehydratase N-terminal domain-containing protein [Actinomycetota bacterium]|nr:MaoC family dehydratase N-terminal domain-containing protein [Actinomycetota bacterium]